MRAFLFAAFVALSAVLVACGGSDESSPFPADTTGQQASSGEREQLDFQLFVSGALQDTLQGNASFGTVVNTNTGNHHFVIEMTVEDDPGSAVYVTHADTTVPGQGSYDLVSTSDSTAQGELAVTWRSGMRRNVSASSGTLTLETSSDTLVAGSMEATLRGVIAESGGIQATEAGTEEVQINGEFRAERGTVGYIGFE
jgi:hypothetical protein